jgi:hypothetical protein
MIVTKKRMMTKEMIVKTVMSQTKKLVMVKKAPRRMLNKRAKTVLQLEL